MGIVVRHGGGLGLAMAQQVGEAQGRAIIAQQEADDAMLRQSLLAGLSIGAQAARQRVDIVANERERERDRLFTQERDESNKGFTLERDNSERAFRAQQNREEQAWRSGENEITRADRAFEVDRAFEANQKNVEADNARLDATAKSQRESDAARVKYYENRQRMEDQTFQQQAEARSEAMTRQQQLLQGLDSEFSDPDTGELMPDATYYAARAEIMEKGHLSKGTMEALPSGQGGRGKYRGRPVAESDAAAIALSMPKKAVEIANIVAEGARRNDPVTGKEMDQIVPAKEAQAMMAAIAQLPYSDAFNPLKNPNYFTDLQNTVKQYREAGAPPELIAPLEQHLQGEKMRRAQVLLPRVMNEVEETMGRMAEAGASKGMPTRSWMDRQRDTETQKRLNAYGITGKEYKEWAAAQAAARSIFRLDVAGGGRRQGRQSTEDQPQGPPAR